MYALAVRAASVLALAVALAACGEAPPPAPAPPPAAPLVAEPDFLRQIDRTRGTRDCFTVLRDPEFVRADAAPHMTDDESVIALDLGEVQVCYPVQYLNHHEIVEHALAGLELLACW